MARTKAPVEEMTFEEVNERYPWEWIAFKVTADGEHGRILRGQLIGHSKQRRRVTDAIVRFRQEEPNATIAVFLGGTRYVQGEEAHRLMDEAAARNPFGNARGW